MAGSRHYWWERYTSKLSPSKWFKGFRKSVTPKTERRRGSRETRPASPAPSGPGGGAQPIRDPYRDIWQDSGGQGSFARQRAFFFGMKVQFESREDELNTWRSFVTNMTQSTGTPYKSPANPFWSDLGRSPRNFDWAGWRVAVWGGRHRTL